ncbi:TPA: L,D-transpeptidase, partial [Legionella pneumophila]|nr:L,D-transpeptidase [Legionella pneumophila]
IHGSNRVDGIGAKVSAGCIRMLPEDIEHLYSLVSVGTPVRIINAPLQRQAD